MKDLKHFILVGPPASGKGTQGRFLADTFNLNSLSTGSLLRREVESCTELGRKALGYMDKAMLVPDEIVNDMVRGWLSEMDNDCLLYTSAPRHTPFPPGGLWSGPCPVSYASPPSARTA